MDFTKPFKITPAVQHYAWGKQGSDSLVAKLAHATDLTKRYAELWFGAHPKLPSTALLDCKQCNLDSLIARHANEILGSEVAQHFGGKLPFLFKVLSIGTNLSIQAHPDKALAAELHEKDPAHYPDQNHKPEVAIAISPVELLYGFRTLAEIKANLARVPELNFLLKRNLAKGLDSVLASTDEAAAIKTIYQTIFSAPASDIEELCKKLYTRLETLSAKTAEDKWVTKLQSSYPKGDVGIFCFYLHNLCTLEPGEGVFIYPGIPHAYLSGDLMECMACSDNTVRGGLTEKFVDVKTLTCMLNFSPLRPAPLQVKEACCLPFCCYDIPAEEFSVQTFKGSIENQEFSNNGQLKLIFCLTGAVEISVSGQAPIVCETGAAAIIPATVSSYVLSCTDSEVCRISSGI